MKHFLLSVMLLAVLTIPAQGIVLAQGTGGETGNTGGSGGETGNIGGSTGGETGNLGGGSGGATKGELLNPLSSSRDFDIVDFLKAVLDIVLIFAVPIIVLFIMYAGFLFVMSRGEPAGIQKARAAFTWAVIGGVIILGAWAILGIIQGTVNSIAS